MDGSIIAIIITTHIPTNDPATPSQVCPGIRIQAIDIVQPPGIIMPPVADIEVQQTTVTAALTPNRRLQTARKAGCEMRSEGMREIYCEAMSLRPDADAFPAAPLGWPISVAALLFRLFRILALLHACS
jgi:hypothetical protein